jgi:hypothetical protein
MLAHLVELVTAEQVDMGCVLTQPKAHMAFPA